MHPLLGCVCSARTGTHARYVCHPVTGFRVHHYKCRHHAFQQTSKTSQRAYVLFTCCLDGMFPYCLSIVDAAIVLCCWGAVVAGCDWAKPSSCIATEGGGLAALQSSSCLHWDGLGWRELWLWPVVRSCDWEPSCRGAHAVAVPPEWCTEGRWRRDRCSTARGAAVVVEIDSSITNWSVSRASSRSFGRNAPGHASM
jgi:hypothetical protein